MSSTSTNALILFSNTLSMIFILCSNNFTLHISSFRHIFFSLVDYCILSAFHHIPFSLVDWHHHTSLQIFWHFFLHQVLSDKVSSSHQFQLFDLHLSFPCSPLKVLMLSLISFYVLNLLFPPRKPLSLDLPLYQY